MLPRPLVKQIREQIEKAESTSPLMARTKSKWPGQAYEYGVIRALKWILHETESEDALTVENSEKKDD